MNDWLLILVLISIGKDLEVVGIFVSKKKMKVWNSYVEHNEVDDQIRNDERLRRMTIVGLRGMKLEV